MVKDAVCITIDRQLLKRIDEIAKREFGGNRSFTIEFLLRKGLKSEPSDIAITLEKSRPQ